MWRFYQVQARKTKVEPSTLQKLHFCKHYATHFLFKYFLLNLKLKKPSVAVGSIDSDFVFLFGENELVKFVLSQNYCNKDPWVSPQISY